MGFAMYLLIYRGTKHLFSFYINSARKKIVIGGSEGDILFPQELQSCELVMRKEFNFEKKDYSWCLYPTAGEFKLNGKNISGGEIFEDSDVFSLQDFSFSFSSNHLPMDSYSWEKGCLIAKKEFSNEEIIISLNGISKTIFLSAFDGPLFQKSIVLAFGYDDKNVPKYWPNYQDKIQNFGFLEEHKDELLYGDILSLTYSGEESWINSTETYYGSGSYCWISPRTTIIDIEIIESTIVSFAFDNLGRLLPIDQNIVIQSYDTKNCPNSINNGLVAFNADGSLIELNKNEGQIIYGSCSQYNIQDTKEYRVHAFYTYYPR